MLTPSGVIGNNESGKDVFSRYYIWIEGFSYIGRSGLNVFFGDYAHSMGNGHNSLLTVWQQYGVFTLISEIYFISRLFRYLCHENKYVCRSQYFGLMFLLTIWFFGVFEASPIISSNGMFVFFGVGTLLVKIPSSKCVFNENPNCSVNSDANKVLIISNVFSYGSIGNIVKELHTNNLKNEIQSYVIYGRGSKVEDFNVAAIEDLIEVFLTKILRKMFKNQYIGNYLMTREIISSIKVLKPRIVHIHSLNDDFVNYRTLLLFLSKLKDTKIIFTNHSEYMYTGTCGAHAFECNQFMTNGCLDCRKCNRKSARKMFATKKKLFEKFNKTTFVSTSVSPWLHNRVKNSIIFKRFEDVVIPNGSNIFEFMPRAISKSNYALYVTPSLDNEAKKAKDIFAIAKLNPNIKFVIASLKKPNSTPNINNIQIRSNITDREEMARLYSEARITVLSGTKETFSMPVIESLICGTPVLGYECGGPESLEISKYTTFVENGNINSLNEMFRKLFNDSYNPREVSEFALNIFSSKNMCEKYQQLYYSFFVATKRIRLEKFEKGLKMEIEI